MKQSINAYDDIIEKEGLIAEMVILSNEGWRFGQKNGYENKKYGYAFVAWNRCHYCWRLFIP